MIKLVVLSVFLAVATAQFVPRLNGRIVGGDDANIEDYPYQLSYQFFGSHICGASIISETWAVTAAHCADGMSANEITVVAGISKLREKDQGQTVGVKRIIMHPSYNKPTHDYDIALLELSSAIRFTDKAQPVPLASAGSEPATGLEVVTTGWGSIYEGGRVWDRLQSVSVNIVDHDKCQQQYNPRRITERMVCAGVPRGGKDACQGDSGGPLVGNGQLVGVVSWGIGCARPNFSGIYANVSNLRQWINEVSGL